jgi:hypothetical protein
MISTAFLPYGIELCLYPHEREKTKSLRALAGSTLGLVGTARVILLISSADGTLFPALSCADGTEQQQVTTTKNNLIKFVL